MIVRSPSPSMTVISHSGTPTLAQSRRAVASSVSRRSRLLESSSADSLISVIQRTLSSSSRYRRALLIAWPAIWASPSDDLLAREPAAVAVVELEEADEVAAGEQRDGHDRCVAPLSGVFAVALVRSRVGEDVQPHDGLAGRGRLGEGAEVADRVAAAHHVAQLLAAE